MNSAPVDGVRRSPFEAFVVVVALVAFSGVALSIPHIQSAELGASASDPLLTVMKAVAACYALWGSGSVLRARGWGIAGWLLIAIHVAAVASVIWSDAPRLTLFRALQLSGTTLFALTVAARFDPTEQLYLLAAACTAVIALNVAALVVIPDTAMMSGEFEGAWRGVFGHKNQLGKFAVMSAAAFACLDRRLLSTRWTRPTGMVSSVVLALASTSKTALVSLIFLFFAFPSLRYLRRQRSLVPHALALAAIVGIAVTILWRNAGYIADLLGRDMTLSGRTALWFAVIAFILQRPLLGYGYAAFWRGMEGDSAYISIALHWDVPHAHNGWLDVGLDLGLVGIVLVAGYFAVCARNAFRTAAERAGGSELWPMMAITVVFIANLTESSLLRANSLSWVILVLAGAHVATARPTVLDSVVPGALAGDEMRSEGVVTRVP